MNNNKLKANNTPNEYIKDIDTFVTIVFDSYRKDDTEMSDEFFRNIFVDMTKAEFMQAYAKIQRLSNGDTIVRLDENLNVETKLIPADWNKVRVKGEACRLLDAINNSRFEDEPIFARITEDGTMLDLVYGEFEHGEK